MKGNRTLNTTLEAAAQSTERVPASIHSYYKYPARFSPDFVTTAISEFTAPGDLVFDPFLGGGTSLSCAIGLDRDFIGIDVNSLSVFIASTMLITLDDFQTDELLVWLESHLSQWTYRSDVPMANDQSDYFRNANTQITKALLKVARLIKYDANQIADASQKHLALCALLKSTQWALDRRRQFPGVQSYKEKYASTLSYLVGRARLLKGLTSGSETRNWSAEHGSVESATELPLFRSADRKAKLIVTSPPYPGVHVLYHRWQVGGKRETSLPYWLVSSTDGNPASYYTLGGRSNGGIDTYFKRIELAYQQMRKTIDVTGRLVQLVGFGDRENQLPRLLSVLANCGFEIDGDDSMLWRDVPGRTWSSSIDSTGNAKEVLLVHRPI
jgi:DNA modification methylase